jgi:hypothetical protein
MKQLSLILVAASGLLVSPAFADQSAKAGTPQTQPTAAAKDMEILRQKLKADKKFLVADNMELTDAEAKGFWPLYDAYQKDLDKVNQRIRKLVDTYSKAYNEGPLSNEASKQLVSDYLSIEAAELDLKRSYVPKLEKVLPPYKMARYLQVENKIRAAVKYELAAEIPVID